MSSFMEVSSEKVVALAVAKRDWIKKRQQEAIEQTIKETIEELNNRFFHRLFRRPSVTREEAIDYDMNHGWLIESEIWRIENYWYAEERQLIDQVLIAATVGSTMKLSLEDVQRLS